MNKVIAGGWPKGMQETFLLPPSPPVKKKTEPKKGLMLLAHWHTKASTLRSIVIIKSFSFIACLKGGSPSIWIAVTKYGNSTSWGWSLVCSPSFLETKNNGLINLSCNGKTTWIAPFSNISANSYFVRDRFTGLYGVCLGVAGCGGGGDCGVFFPFVCVGFIFLHWKCKTHGLELFLKHKYQYFYCKAPFLNILKVKNKNLKKKYIYIYIYIYIYPSCTLQMP